MAGLAFTYAAAGVLVFPCHEFGSGDGKPKSPRIRGGFRTATANLQMVSQWWWRWPNAVVGLPCAANDILVLDADRHGNGDGVEAIYTILAKCAVDPYRCCCSLTPNSGRHFIFRRPIGLGATRGNLGSAIDVKNNGYIIAPGSFFGRTGYQLLGGATPNQFAEAIAQRTLPELPATLAAMLDVPHIEAEELGSWRVSEARAPDVTARLNSLLQKVVSGQLGQRNKLLHWAACRLGEMTALGQIQNDVAWAFLVAAGQEVGLTLIEVMRTARSGIYAGYASIRNGR